MTPEKKTNWWAVGGIVSVLALGISTLSGSNAGNGVMGVMGTGTI